MATTINSGYANSPKLTANIADHADVYGGRALVFDGVSDYLDCGTDLATRLGNNYSGDLSISLWMKPNGHGNDGVFTIGNFSNTAGAFLILIYNNELGWHLNAANWRVKITGFNDTNWNHLVCTYKSGSESDTNMYLNGESVGTKSGTFPSASDFDLDSLKTIIGAYYNASYPFNGRMADVKIFDSALTEAQVQELYKKPENTPSAVQDNLIAWYPMIEGNPESPQSIVYDHSEKKLGSDIITNGDYSNGTTGWSIGAGGTADTSSGALVYTYSGSGNNFVKQEGITAVNGALYKAVFTVTESGGSAYYGYWDGTNLSSSVITLDTGQKTYTQYFTATSTSITIRFVAGSSNGNSITVDNVSVKQVQMGNHATTNFFGDDLQTGTWNNSDLVGFTGASANGFTAVNTDASVGNNDNAYGDEISFVAGKTYKMSFTLAINSGSIGSIFVGVTSGTAGSADSILSYTLISSADDYSYTFTPTSTVTRRPSFRFVVNGTYNFTISNFEVKEVGVSSSGFETAVNEPVVPQVPLMRYNQNMIFDGVNDYVLVPGGLTGGLEELTISVWARKKIGESVGALFAVAGGGDYAQWFSATRIYWTNTMSGGTGAVNAVNVVDNGKMNHYVFTTKSGEAKIYQNGILLATSTSGTGTVSSNYRNLMAYSAGGKYSTGDGNEFAFFNKVLTQAEVIELFNDGVALDATTHSKASALKAYWRNDGVTTWKNRADNFATFNGVNDVITRNAINVDYKSVSFWMRPSTTTTTASSSYPVMTFFDWAYSAVAIGSSTSYFTNELIMIQESVGGGVKKTAFIPSAGETIPSDSWTHIAFVWNGSNYDIYFNGVKKSVVANTGETNGGHVPLSTNKTLRFGHGGASGGTFYGGDLTGIAIWSESLTSEQVLSIYNSGHNGNIASIQSSDLQLYYTFNPNASTDADTNSSVQDRSGNNNDSTSVSGALINKDGTVQGSPDSITIREGLNSNRDGLGFYFTNPSSNVLRLNGVDEQIIVPDTDFNFSGQMTFECWAKNNSDNNTVNEFLISQYNYDNNQRAFRAFIHSNGALYCTVSASGGSTISQANTTNAISNLDNWHHYAFTFKSGTSVSEIFAIYIDGVAVTISTGSVDASIKSIHNSTADIQIGSSYPPNATGGEWNGLIDEVKIYNRALSLAEIQKNYKHQKGKHKND